MSQYTAIMAHSIFESVIAEMPSMKQVEIAEQELSEAHTVESLSKLLENKHGMPSVQAENAAAIAMGI